MSDGWIHWYRTSTTVPELAQQWTLFAEFGLMLENPSSHRVTSLDEIGDQVLTDAELLTMELTRGQDVSFQLWLDGSTDVYSRFRRLSQDTTVQSYGLDGLTHAERRRVQSILWTAFGGDLAYSDALVVDLYDRTESVDWDAAVASRTVPPGTLPDLLAIKLGGSAPISAGQPAEFRVIGVLRPPDV
jgi:hypothetical protein